MKIATYLYQNNNIITNPENDAIESLDCQLVMGFGAKGLIAKPESYMNLRERFPNAEIAMCSTAGEIFATEVLDDTMSVIALQMEKTLIKTASVNVDMQPDSYKAGAELVSKLDQDKLKYILILSDGSKVNGSELVRGIESVVTKRIPVTGGLAGDGTRFSSTLVGLNSLPAQGNIVAIGFYGDAIQIGHGSMGGWEVFGPERTVTRSESNRLYEIDDNSALELYKNYLGKYAEGLPGSALLFPLSVKLSDSAEPVVRTILSIDEPSNSMIFAGDVPQGSKIRFMKANFDRLIDAATDAAQSTLVQCGASSPKLALLISCVGRKAVLDRRIDEEVEAVALALGGNTFITGFYSYGEISPLSPYAKCELHNQTMTITTFDEK